MYRVTPRRQAGYKPKSKEANTDFLAFLSFTFYLLIYLLDPWGVQNKVKIMR